MRLVVDNTFLTPYFQRPLELGADVIIHSTTKYIDDHNATLGGAAVSRTVELDERIRFIQNATGTIMSPQVAWLTLQGIKTLSVRMDHQSANAMAIAARQIAFGDAPPSATLTTERSIESVMSSEPFAMVKSPRHSAR